MTILLFMVPTSPAVHSVQMTAEALGIKLELKQIDMTKGENKTTDYLKMNPQHTVPVINDNGVILWDSHAINAYLVSKYGKNDSLYPKDPVKRAVVDQRLHFDSSVLFPRVSKALAPIFLGQKNALDQTDIDSFNEICEFLEKFLEGRKWIADDSVTIADYSVYSTVVGINLVSPIDPNKFPKFSAWCKQADALPERDVIKESFKTTIETMNKHLKK